MIDLRATQPGWNRRDFLKSSAAVAAGVYAMRWGLALAADIPLEFDGSKFQLKAAEPNPKHGGVIRMGIPVRPPHFDLHQSGTIFNLGAMGCMFDNLIRRDPRDGGKTVIPDLAHSWQIAKDAKTYTFFLRQGVQFSDGAELTADDVKATFDRIAKPPQGITIPRSILFKAVERDQRARQIHRRIQIVGSPPSQLHDVGARQRLQRDPAQENAGRQPLRPSQSPGLSGHRPISQCQVHRKRSLDHGEKQKLLEQGAAVSGRDRVLPRSAVLPGNGIGDTGEPRRLCVCDRSRDVPEGGGDTGDVDRDPLPERPACNR